MRCSITVVQSPSLALTMESWIVTKMWHRCDVDDTMSRSLGGVFVSHGSILEYDDLVSRSSVETRAYNLALFVCHSPPFRCHSLLFNEWSKQTTVVAVCSVEAWPVDARRIPLDIVRLTVIISMWSRSDRNNITRQLLSLYGEIALCGNGGTKRA